MKLKQTYRYQLLDCRAALCVFYFVIFCVCALTLFGATGFSLIVNGEVEANFAGMELASLIFLFVVGLNSYTEPFTLLSQNGVTRRTFFLGNLLTQTTLAVGMALVDRVILMLLTAIMGGLGGQAKVYSLFDLFFRSEFYLREPPAQGLGTLIPVIGLYFLALAVGLFIVILYKRLNKAGIIAVSVGVPVTLCILLPLLDETILHGAVDFAASRFLVAAFALAADAPFLALGCTMLVVAVIDALCWLMLRRLPLKK